MAIVALGLWAAPAAAAVDGLEVDSKSTYRLDPEHRRVDVTTTVHLVNTMPSETVGAYVRTPYFDEFALPLVGPVDDVRAESNVGGSLSTRLEGHKGLTGLIVDLEPNLVYGTPQTLTVRYTLPGQPSRSRSLTRVNPAFASWFVYGAGDPDDVAVVVDVPKAYEVTFSQYVQPLVSHDHGRSVYELTGTEDPGAAAIFVSASNDAELARREVQTGSTVVTVKSWPGDDKWAAFTAKAVRRGLPVLGDLTGVDTPEKRLTVLESSSTYHLGYAGVYLPDERVAQVGDVLDKRVILHELSHVWFNQDLFFERWIGEGLAEDMSNRAMGKLGGRVRKPKPIRATPAAVPLNGWVPGGPLDRQRFRTDAYVYNAAFSVINQLTRDIGPDGMRKVLSAASENRIPYTGDPAAEEMDSVQDWRYFYDLLEMVGGAQNVERLFRAHILTSEQVGDLAERSDARQQLEDLTEAGDGWTPPLQVRQSMAAWGFIDAVRLMDDAEDLLEDSKTVADAFADAGVDVSQTLEDAYESSSSLTALSDALDEYRGLADDVVAVNDRVAAAGPVTRLGLLGASVDFDEVEAALQDGDREAVPALLTAMDQQLVDANERGTKILIGAAVLLLLIIGFWLLRRRRRRTRAAVPADDEFAVGPEPTPAAELVDSDSYAEPYSPDYSSGS